MRTSMLLFCLMSVRMDFGAAVLFRDVPYEHVLYGSSVEESKAKTSCNLFELVFYNKLALYAPSIGSESELYAKHG